MATIREIMGGVKRACAKERCLVMASFISTPFIIFIITSIELYIQNRTDLDDKLIVLVPFFLLFIFAVFGGYIIFHYSRKKSPFKLLLLFYYLAGPSFLAYSAARHSQFNVIARILIFIVLFGLVFLYFYKKFEIYKLAKIFAWFSLIIIIGELSTVVINGVKIFETSDQKNTQKSFITENLAGKALPNIYQIIFDEYQTDMFDLTLDEETKKQLSGFTHYPKNTAVYGRTGMSLPTIFTGRSYDYEMPQIEYQKQAFNSDKSLLFWLKKAGYETNAFTHKIYTFDMELFDSVTEHKKNTYFKINNDTYTKLFLNLWIYANLPRAITEKMIKSESISQIKAQNTLAGSTPIINYGSFKNIVENKELLAGTNKYIFIHLIFPHFPYIFKSDCSYDNNSETSPLEQSQCATKMITDFLGALKKYDKFDDSMIIIQSDHGARFKVEKDNLVSIEEEFYSEEWSLARARTLLLIKYPGKKSTDPFLVSDAETSLLDIAPTIIDAAGFPADLNAEGVLLTNPETLPAKRQKYYHFFEKKGKNEQTDELSRYIIENGAVKFEKKIRLGK